MLHVKQIEIKEPKLIWLYKNAIALVITSLYEGFGIPLIEAFRCECPVICSDQGSLPEIAQNNVLFFNPNDSTELKGKMNQIIGEKEVSISLKEKGLKRSHYFSWDQTIQQVEQQYRRTYE